MSEIAQVKKKVRDAILRKVDEILDNTSEGILIDNSSSIDILTDRISYCLYSHTPLDSWSFVSETNPTNELLCRHDALCEGKDCRLRSFRENYLHSCIDCKRYLCNKHLESCELCEELICDLCVQYLQSNLKYTKFKSDIVTHKWLCKKCYKLSK